MKTYLNDAIIGNKEVKVRTNKQRGNYKNMLSKCRL